MYMSDMYTYTYTYIERDLLLFNESKKVIHDRNLIFFSKSSHETNGTE